MKYFKDINNTVYAYESDGSQDDYIRTGLIAISKAEVDALIEQNKSATLVCTAYQIREALNQLGWRELVENAVSNSNQSLRDAWEYAAEFRRDHSKIAEIAAAIGKTDADIDALFALAVTLAP